MAHTHFNGTCEQSARNFHGAIARNFHAGNLGARLSCKPATPYNRIVSSAMIPSVPEEDFEVETRRAIRVTSPHARAGEVREYARQSSVISHALPTYATIHPANLHAPDIAQAIKALHTSNSPRKRAQAHAVLQDAMTFYANRINKATLRRYRAGQLSAEDALVRAGIVGKWRG